MSHRKVLCPTAVAAVVGMGLVAWAPTPPSPYCRADPAGGPAATRAPAHHVESTRPVGEAPVETTVVSGVTFQAKEVRYIDAGGLGVLEGDIVIGRTDDLRARRSGSSSLTPDGDRQARAVVGTGALVGVRWPSAVVPYLIDPALPDRSRVEEAIAHWQAVTRIRLVPTSLAEIAANPKLAFVCFMPASGCYSYIGREGGPQDIGLAPGSDVGTVIHEIGHAVGLWHEQSRETGMRTSRSTPTTSWTATCTTSTNTSPPATMSGSTTAAP